MKKRVSLGVLILSVLGFLAGDLVFSVPANAQQTIFNVPSADVTPEGELFLQHESQFRPWDDGSFWLGTHYGAYGIGHHTEIDTTLMNVSTPGSDNITLGIGLKTAWPLLEKQLPERELKLTVGEMLPVSLQQGNVGNWTYAHVSGRLPKLNTRLTGGVSTGTRQIFGRNTVGFIGGLEQPVTRKLSLIADWYSGSHANGLLITGVSYALPSRSTLYVGYQIPNNKQTARGGFVVELSKFFF